MEKYVKLPINTPAAQAIKEVFKNKKAFFEKFHKLAEKYGWRDCYRSSFDLCGIECVIFKDGVEIDRDLYKKEKQGTYSLKRTKAPKEKREAQKKLTEDWHSLRCLSISRNEIDRCIGKIRNNWNWAGVDMTDDFVLIVLGDPDNYDLPKECVEISYSEWKTLSDTNK